jgi:hypothetical protein
MWMTKKFLLEHRMMEHYEIARTHYGEVLRQIFAEGMPNHALLCETADVSTSEAVWDTKAGEYE